MKTVLAKVEAEEIRQLEETGRQLEATLGREPSDQELATELGWSVERVRLVGDHEVDQEEEDFQLRFRMTVKNYEMEKRRLQLGLYQKDLAKMTGIAVQRITSIECCRYMPTEEEMVKIAEALKATPQALFPEWLQVFSKKWKDAEKEKIVTRKSISLEGGGVGLLPSGEEQAPHEVVERNTAKEILKKAIADLQPRTRKLIAYRWGLNDGVTRTLRETGEYFGISPERTRQVEARGMMEIQEGRYGKELKEVTGYEGAIH